MMKELPHTHSCFVCGASNAHGLHLRFHTDGQHVTTQFTPRPEHIGFKGVVHGGITATVLDEIMVWACLVATQRFAFCAELTVRYHRPLMPGTRATVTSALVANRKDRLFEAEAQVTDAAGQTIATATGKYIPVPASELPTMAADFVGDASWVKLPATG